MSSSDFVVVSNLTYPDKNILTLEDIDHILKSKMKFKELKWDNKKLGFNLKNEKNFYTFSVPYFNLAHDKVILMYRYICPDFCGFIRTIVLIKNGTTWDITRLQTTMN